MTSERDTLSYLPEELPIFPLNTTLFPRWELPLNIFEPRYLNLFDDANIGNKLIGMIQPFGGTRARPLIAKTGCVGLITDYDKTPDGRYHVILTGLLRFKVVEELDVITPYRQIKPDFSDFADDLEAPLEADLPDRLRLEAALQIYADNNRPISLDWEAFQKTPMELLIHGLISELPFTPLEKQALLEAATLNERCETLIKLLSMYGTGKTDGATGPNQ